MFRLMLLFAFISLMMTGAAAYKRWENAPDRRDWIQAKGVADIVAMPDGSTFMAVPGSPTRALTDWLHDGKSKLETFELGGQQFIARTDRLTPESLGRMPRLVSMLKSYPEIRLHAVGHAARSGNLEADRTIALMRAKRLVETLRDGGIASHRLYADERGSSEPLVMAAPSEARNDRVTVVLERK